MKKLILIGIVIIAVSVCVLGASFVIGFGDCFKDDCYEPAYAVSTILGFLGIAVGLLAISIGIVKLAIQDPSKRYILIIAVLLYTLLGFGAYYYFLGGKHYFEERSFFSRFQTTYYEPSNLQDGYSKQHTFYSPEGSAVYGPGNYTFTTYKKPVLNNEGDTYYKNFDLRQGDQANDAADILLACKEKGGCDVIDGKNVKGIYCQQTNENLCAVEIQGTYVSVSGFGNAITTREESVAILDSLVPKQ